MQGFVAISRAPGRCEDQILPAIERAKSMGLSVRYQADRLAVLASKEIAVQSLNGACGAIIGDVFSRGMPVSAVAGSSRAPNEISRAVVDGRVQDNFWGDFVAIHYSTSGSLRFLHSPCGSINLYYIVWEDSLLIASDSSMLLALAGRRRSLNWAAVAHNLVWDDISPLETCLDGVHEIRCGEEGNWQGGNVSVETVWSPWRYTEANISISTSEEAVEIVRHELLRSVGSRRPFASEVAIDLSGGLDSSIIAAACAASGIETTCINLYDSGTEGDERQFARSVAEHLKVRLVEASPSAEDVDLDICARAHLPRPYVRSFVQAFDKCALRAASSRSATAFMNGGGGDSVFCHLQSSGPVVDALKSRTRVSGVIRIANDVSRAAQCSFWEVTKMAGRKLMRGSSADRATADTEFLRPECLAFAETIPSSLPQPQSQPLPGKIEQVHGIYRALYNLNGFSRSDHMKGVFPLLSQPLVEACLRIPTWLSVGKGRNRLIARLAIESQLPPMATWRTSKGGLGRLQRDLLRTRREQLRAKLLDGKLASQGLIDRSAIERELKDETTYRVENAYRLLRLCDVETWCST
jgi:asparagine synthase (glutamine-hydrolysing)